MAVLLVFVVLLGAGGMAFRHSTAPAPPTAEVKRGEFVDYVQVRGDVRALSSKQITAPSISGDLLIVKLVAPGTMVKQGDVVAQFDPATLRNTLQLRQSDLKAADADIEQTRADSRLTAEQQATDLLQGRYDVDRGKLDVNKGEILSEIEGAENKLKLADSQQKFKELQQKDVSTRDASAADIEGKKQKRVKSQFDVTLTERQLAALTLRAPSDGMVTILPNFRAYNWMTGGTAPDFRAGDHAWSGAIIAEIPDLSSVRVNARIEEIDRGRVKLGQPAFVRIDAIPEKEFHATVAEISPLAKPDYSSWPPAKNFDMVMQITDPDPRIRPGMNATARIAVETIPNGTLVPARYIFDRNGRSVAFVLQGSKFVERTVDIARRSKSELLIGRGLQPGERIATEDPEQSGKQQGPRQ
ncbi:MAG TPA: efflux RND transporter periplasmic adaptor subunit [Candidatus Angelobacter sp.]|nr:efflux RND transporter periplasmic adaptor subunit [Candidatus Angelobacter sp.]